jgi:hypothetical protein
MEAHVLVYDIGAESRSFEYKVLMLFLLILDPT